MIKVLVLIDAWFPFVGGAQVQIRNLKKVLEKDFKVKYYILHSPSANVLIRFLWSFWVIPQAIILNRKEKFDLIHAHAYWPGIPGKIISTLTNLPVVFTVHGSNLLDLNIKSIRYYLEKYILTKIHYNWVISVSSNFKNYSNINKNISIIPNGVSIHEFNKVKVKKSMPFKILFVGRDDSVKGLIYLKQAMKLVKQEIPQARLAIIQKVFSRELLIREYKSSHVFVLPSLSEGQPLTLLEAWAAKLPVVVTKVGENPNMVKNGVNGYLVSPASSKDLSKAILTVLKGKNRKKLGENGFNYVSKNLTWQRCAQKTYEVYKKNI
ncbi:glycosyltransferase family 4 protein [Patescibacteria group bacterium]